MQDFLDCLILEYGTYSSSLKVGNYLPNQSVQHTKQRTPHLFRTV